MIMSTVGRGGEGDVGQRIRDEILVIQVCTWVTILIFKASVVLKRLKYLVVKY